MTEKKPAGKAAAKAAGTGAATSDSAGEQPAHDDPGGVSGMEFPDVPALSYEDARDQLTAIVASLEGGQVPLEESMRLWRRGEALAAHCSGWLDGAQREITEMRPAGERS